MSDIGVNESTLATGCNESIEEASETTSQFNANVTDVSIPLLENEMMEMTYQETSEVRSECESLSLNTIPEESLQTIDLIDESECSLQISKATTVASEKTICDVEEITQISVNEEKYFQSSVVELARRLWNSTQDAQHYTKGCLWSPDGTCLLVPVHLEGMHVMELPRDLYNVKQLTVQRKISELPTAVHVKEGGTVYDFAWYPFMNSESPESCCWLATRQHEPIHLWDAFTGELRCTYRGYDQVDEVEAAISVIFSNNGEKVIGGYKKSIKVFDTNTPGRDYDLISVTKAVSCFAFASQSESAVTTGSWNGYIDHYDLRASQLGSLFTLGGHDGGVTWLKYSKNEPIMLFSGARRDNKLLQWDMRNYKEPYKTFKRSVSTNQRIYFDLSPQEEWLVSGDSNGLLHVWNLTTPEAEYAPVPIHTDCCNGVSFHPTLPFIATSSGQYHFLDVVNESNAPENDEGCTIKSVKYENSLLLLWIEAMCPQM